MQIYLLRHGIAIDRDLPESPPEADRYLTEQGIQRTKAAAKGMLHLGIAPERVLSSPWLRARQTAEITMEQLELDRALLSFSDSLLWSAEPERLLQELRKLQKYESVLCVGHAPQLDEFLSFLVGAKMSCTSLKKAGLAYLEMEEPLEGGDAMLIALYPPKVLRALGNTQN